MEVDYAEVRRKCCSLPFAARQIQGMELVVAACPQANAALRRMTAGRARYRKEDVSARKLIATAAAQLFAVDAPLARVREMTQAADGLTPLYEYWGLGTLAGMCRWRYALQLEPSDTPRWLWATVYAHILHVEAFSRARVRELQASGLWGRPGGEAEAARLAGMREDALMKAAKYAGPHFACFLQFVALVHAAGQIEPLGVVEVADEFAALLRERYGGCVPPGWFFVPPQASEDPHPQRPPIPMQSRGIPSAPPREFGYAEHETDD